MSYVTEPRRPSMVDRRPSMAERRPSMANGRKPSVIPQLAGIEKPISPQTPETCDVLICGTGLVESILAAALAWQGSNVLHVDSNPYYGDTCATLTIDQLKDWVHSVNQHTPGFQGFSKALLYIPRPQDLVSRDYGIDLTPRVVFARSDLMSLLTKSRVHMYLEFQSLSNFHTFENDSFGKLQTSKEDIFTDQSLSLATKRHLMKFLKFIFEYDSLDNLALVESYKDKSIQDFLQDRFKLDGPQINELVYSLGLSASPDISIPEGLSRIRRYLVSFNVLGQFPVLFSKYGGPGEVSQGFCRSAAVAGSTYKLNCALQSFDPKTKLAKFSDGTSAHVTEKVVCSPSQAPPHASYVPEMKYEITRLITVVKKSCREWMAENETAAIVVFPTASLSTNNKYPVQVLIMGAGTGTCPVNQCVWYLSTIQKGEVARKDLEAALLKLEDSILRESEDGFDVSLDPEDIIVKPDGATVINSVKLGKSFKDFVPKEKLQYLFKLCFTQHTAVPPFGVVSSSLFDTSAEKPTTDGSGVIPDSTVIYSNMPSTEISYDGVVTEAKLLYEKIVGSDDDFFDVDFENEDEDNDTLTDVAAGDEDAIIDDDEEEHSKAFKDEMDFDL
ncbi:unnamed protein product [Kuraishia capsulata CBS 1993]|uniref:Rab proteins geranylgeranyltransferase n=1 Tax=Kuraishia capsulata CBS 1993 TaxID=1382522 RepID=W6MJB6_9ASCO|nr:uncharacterized protein KUCA_T00002592001 [Kuraishia capsulata CBS 1993]CDK26619.1 unnamed protein product [Kuraishia capsulata CBS 1993]